MKLVVNGEGYELKEEGSVKTLLLELNADCERVAIMINDEVIPRDKRDSVTLKENDRVEVLTFAAADKKEARIPNIEIRNKHPPSLKLRRASELSKSK